MCAGGLCADWRAGDDSAWGVLVPKRHSASVLPKEAWESEAIFGRNGPILAVRHSKREWKNLLLVRGHIWIRTFDPLANATDCPNESWSLSYSYTDRSFCLTEYLLEVRTVETETISFCTNVISINLVWPTTRWKAVNKSDWRSWYSSHTQKLRSENSNTIDSMESLLELILKHYHKPGCGDFAHLDAFIKVISLRDTSYPVRIPLATIV